MGAAGEVIPFMLLLALEGVVGFYVFSYAAQTFLTVVQETAAGNDEVTWPDEPLLDRFWKVFYLAWVVFCSAVPAVFVVPLLYGLLPKGSHLLKVVLGGIPVLWLLFPLCLLSTLSAGSAWMVVNPGLFRRAGKRLGSMAVFYGLTAPLGAGWVLLLSFALPGAAGASGTLLLLAAPATAAAILIYARLVGCLGWIISRTPVRQARKQRPKKRERPRPVPARDPWAVPEEKRARRGPPVVLPLDGPVEGYDLEDEVPPEERQAAREPAAERPTRVPFDGPADPYEVSHEPPPPQPQVHRSEEEERLARPRTPPPALPLPWTSGTWTFPWYSSSMGPWLWLSLGFLILSAVFLLQMRFAGFLRES